MTRTSQRVEIWIVLATLTALVAAALIGAPPARACSCEETSGGMLWPLRDAMDVPVDTPIVVYRMSFSADPNSIPIRLLDAEGTEVALTETRQLEQLEPACWTQQTVFLRPAEPLAPNAMYAVHVGEGAGRSFTTGSSTYQRSDYPAPRLRYVHVGPVGACSEDDWWCNLGELDVAFDSDITDGIWLVLRSRAAWDNENRMIFASASWFDNMHQQVSVNMLSDDPCVELTLYGVDGSIVLERELCEPDACVLYRDRGTSSCGEPATSTLNLERVPNSDCSAPITIERGSFGPLYPEPEPSPSDAGVVVPVDAGAAPARDAGEDPADDTGRTDAAPALDSGGGARGSAEPGEPTAARSATGCGCSVLGGTSKPLASAAGYLAMLALVRLARRRSRRGAAGSERA